MKRDSPTLPGLLRAGVVLIALAILMGCSHKEPIPFPIELQLRPSDLPDTVSRTTTVYEDLDQGVSRTTGFRARGQWFIALSHGIYLMDSERAAAKLYQSEVERLFPTDDWRAVEGFDFTPSSEKDKFTFACLENNLGGGDMYSCTLVQLHGRLLSVMHANVDGDNLKMEDFEHAARTVDSRIAAWRD